MAIRRRETALAFAAGIFLIAIAVLVVNIVNDLRMLSSAKSDNAQWTLSQVEVEFLEFQRIVDAARDSDTPDLRSVRREFDIIYSRLRILSEGSLYAPLRDTEDFSEALTSATTSLDSLIPLIDGPDATLRVGLSRLSEVVMGMRTAIREIATAGLYVFAVLSDERRTSFARTFLQLAFLTLALILALLYLLRHLDRIGRKAKKRGAELQSAYVRLNTILQTSLDGVIVSDMSGRIQEFNKAAERIFGYSRDEVIGRSIGETIVPDSLRAAHDDGIARHLATRETHVIGRGRVRLEARRRSGETFPVELALEAAKVGSSEIVVGFLRDISARVAAETELVDARDKALAGEKAKADFLAMMTHEIRTPLNGMLGNLSLLRGSAMSQDQSRYVHNMEISGKLLMSHVDTVLDIARFESGAAKLREEPVHLGRLVQDVVDSQVTAAEQNGNQLEWSWFSEPVHWVLADASRLQQILLNLLGNAIKFTRNGRIAIELEVTRSGTPTEVHFRIIDTGLGISASDLPRVFDDFHTGATPLDDGMSGTGLGLGIARRFVEEFGGEIGAESELGEGSVFWFSIPFALATPPSEQVRVPRRSVKLSRRNILLVEDNEINLHVTREMLVRLGHTVAIARDGQQAVDMATEQGYDLILMDIRMPVMDGLTATRRIREGVGPCRDVPIIALSANVLPEARGRFVEDGMSGFLGKPLSSEELELVLERFAVAPTDPPVALIAEPEPPVAQRINAQDAHTQASNGQVRPVAGADADPVMAKLIERYNAEVAELFDWLAECPGDRPEIAARCHKIAGSAAAFGQVHLRSALVDIENASTTAEEAELEELIIRARQVRDEAPPPALE